MNPTVRAQYEAFPDPSPTAVPIGSGQLDRLSDDLHYGWSWHRHRFCFRRAEPLRILDAGCGTGLTTLGLARLNPGATVLGLDASPRALDLARQRAEAASLPGVSFREHDLESPLPGADGPFDFIICRRVLGQATDPAALLRNLSRALDARGLLLATFPAHPGRQPARRMRRAVEALAPPGTGLAEKAAIGLELFQALRPEHPIRQFEEKAGGSGLPDVERFIVTYLNEAERDFELDEAITTLEAAGLQFLYAATRMPWHAGRALANQGPEGLRERIATLTPTRLATLMGALDLALHGDEFRLYACPADFEPRLPGWPERRVADPAVFERLIPHQTGLAAPLDSPDARKPTTIYRAASGALARIDPRADLLYRAVDGQRTCGEIAQVLNLPSESPADFQDRWLGLVNHGLILLESPDPRQHVDCRFLGPVRDRLNCPCPRLWVRTCDRYGSCTLETPDPISPEYSALQAALGHLNLGEVASCDHCPDYLAEE